MGKITSLSGVVTLPEFKLNGALALPEVELKFVIHLSEDGPKGIGAQAINRILDKASGLPPEMQEIIAEFADYLARREDKAKGQGPVT